MKKIFIALVVMIVVSNKLYAAPAFKTVSLKSAYMKYNSEVLVLEFENTISGGCTNSTIAVSNPGAANNNELISFALAALMARKPVDIAFGGGCQNGDNWLQTIKVSR